MSINPYRIGRGKGERETRWYNKEVQESIKEKKEAKKTWDKLRDKKTKKMYTEKQSKAKKAVAVVKGRAYEDLYGRLETKKVRRNCTD